MGDANVLVINTKTAELVGFVGETLLYGVHLTLWIISTYILCDRHRLRRPVPTPVNKLVLAGSSLICTAVTARWILDCIRIWKGFLGFQGMPVAALLYFTKFGDAINAARVGSGFIACGVLDAFLVYRVYIIWEESLWHAGLPALCLLGFLVSGVGSVYKFAPPVVTSEIWHTSAPRWITALLSMSVATNVVAALLITFRLAQLSRTVHALGVPRTQRGLAPAVRIVIESAAVYCLCTIVTLVGFLVRTDAATIATGITNPLVGISFSLIIIRVGIDLSVRPYPPTSLPRVLSYHEHPAAMCLPTTSSTPTSPIYSSYPAQSLYPSDGQENDSGDTLFHASAPAPLGVALHRCVRVESEGSTDADRVDPLRVKAGD